MICDVFLCNEMLERPICCARSMAASGQLEWYHEMGTGSWDQERIHPTWLPQAPTEGLQALSTFDFLDLRFWEIIRLLKEHVHSSLPTFAIPCSHLLLYHGCGPLSHSKHVCWWLFHLTFFACPDKFDQSCWLLVDLVDSHNRSCRLQSKLLFNMLSITFISGGCNFKSNQKYTRNI